MGQQKIATWIDEPAFIGSDSLRASVSRVVGEAASRDGDISGLSLSKDRSSHADGEKVEEALSLFDHLSLQLTSSYRNLENKVSQLKNDLSVEEEQRREQLKEKEKLANRLSTLLEILPAGVVLLDENGVVSECNPAALDLLGEPLKGQAWVDVIKRSFSPKHDDGHEVSLKDGRRVKIETRSMSSGPGQLVLLSDLTETRLLQEKVSRTERLSSLGKMVASLAHQIRTPLSTAMLYTGHLCQSGLDESIRVGIAEKVMSRLTHLEHQIRDMLVFAKGDTRLAERLPIREFLAALRSAAEPVLNNAGVECEWDVAEHDTDILCNKDSLVGACLNLINNSIEAGDQQNKLGSPKLLLKIVLRLKDNGRLALTIKDNGPGIPNNHRNKVFEPFYTTKPQGTGLGLAVVQAVVKAHQGSFSVRSSKTGVTAFIELPCLASMNASNEFAQS